MLSGAATGSVPRSLVSDSWQRSLAARVDPDRHDPPVVHRAADLDGVRAAHPLGAVLPLLRSTLVSIADEAVHVMIVTDADGTILWREGAHSLLRAADSVGLAPGMRWSEDAIGTNAMGTALAVDEPVQIHSAEHLVRTVHSWTCAAAPVHDPDTGTLLGAIDISGPCTPPTRRWCSWSRPRRSWRRTSYGCGWRSRTSSCGSATCRTWRACAACRARW